MTTATGPLCWQIAKHFLSKDRAVPCRHAFRSDVRGDGRLYVQLSSILPGIGEQLPRVPHI
jgi:hypothetical protein